MLVVIIREDQMIIFNTDLDNTIIYSYKHDIGADKICAEVYQGREISFITKRTSELLMEVNGAVELVPTTTRTLEQYERIDLGIGTPHYALVCNGGVLLIDGKEDEQWYRESYSLVEDCQPELQKAEALLAQDKNRSFEIRNIRSLFIFTKSSEPELSVKLMKESLDTDLMDVFSNGVKVYAVPKALSKGHAVKRLRERLGAELVIAAGDSEFDVPLLNAADVAIAPHDFPEFERLTAIPHISRADELFSEFVLETVLEQANQSR